MAALLALTLSATAAGHGGSYPGGTYRGPGDTVPPGAGGGSSSPAPTTPGPSGPATPGPSGPSTPGPGGPATPGAPGGANPINGPTTGPRNASPDLLAWDYWWTFNRHRYLELRSALYAQPTLTGSDDYYLGHGTKDSSVDVYRPSVTTIRETVVPALVRALEKERASDILTAALIALAKIGEERAGRELTPLFLEFLKDGNQEVAETAAISLGISASAASVPMLTSLMNDGKLARRWLLKDEVPLRTRSFAAYGLGLIGAYTGDDVLRAAVARHLVRVLDSPHFSRRDVKVAAMTAIGLTPLPWSAETDETGIRTRGQQLAFLLDYFDEGEARANKRTRHWYVRAHAPQALARLLAGAPPELEEQVAKALLSAVHRHSKLRDELQMSCVLALGQVGDAGTSELSETIRAELARLAAEGDQQSRRFALIALAQTGGTPGAGPDPLAGAADVREVLLRHLSRGKTMMKPWSALALGVLGRQLIDAGSAPSESATLALRVEAADNRRPSEIGAYVIALGMRRDAASREVLADRMRFFKGSIEARGYTAVALGMIGDRDGMETLRALIDRSRYRPELMRMAAIGLGLLGDKAIVPELVTMLGEARSLATQASVATALGSIGDARSIEPLVGMLRTTDITDTARAFAAAALGIVCDKEPLVWNSRISSNLNYRASTVTLTGSGMGVLDIL
ncbi:MAG: hypothetical protein GY711_00165 [bacterium]|nr:hypothetical protein [bacterium]